jgi:hypothetical protein
LQGNPLIHVNDPSGLFTSDELPRVHDAVDAATRHDGFPVQPRRASFSLSSTLPRGIVAARGIQDWPAEPAHEL